MPALPYLAFRLFNTPLLITQEYGQVIASALADRLNVEPIASQATIDRYVRPGRSVALDKQTGVVVLPIVGATVHRGDAMDALSGVTGYVTLQAQLGSFIDNPAVRAVLVDIDSGGGEAAGLSELADFIRQARSQKPVWAIANTIAASAAYWLGSSAERLIAAPQSTVGSIGVYVQHVDMSELLEKRGIVTSLVFAGKHKVDGNPYETLPEHVRANLQTRVDSLYGDFTAAVASNRRISEASVRATEARMYGPEEALDLGLVDGIGTLGQTIAAMGDMLGAAR